MAEVESKETSNGAGAHDMAWIASSLGVSKTTVFRALHNKGRVSPETRAKVLKLAQSVRYRPNQLAAGLRATKTQTVGVVVPGLNGSVVGRISEGAEEAARESGYRLLMGVTHHDVDRESDLIAQFIERRVDGLLIVPTAVAAPTPAYRELSDRGIPFVLLDRTFWGEPIADSVTTDHRLGGRLVGEHLVEAGRRRPAFACLLADPAPPRSIVERYGGFCEALSEAGVPAPFEIQGQIMDLARAAAARNGAGESPHSFSELFLTAMREALQPFVGDPPFDSIFAAYDHAAASAMHLLAASGIPVPERVAVASFDDQDFTEYLHPPLTTVRQPFRRIGLTGMRLLAERIAAGGPPDEFQQIRIEPRLIVRRSTGTS